VRSLLDVNVLIALFDPDHVHHRIARAWWAENAAEGWASCPLTENGVIRIMAGPAYATRLGLGPADMVDLLATFAGGTDHEFWPDGLSLRIESVFPRNRLLTSAQITDTYLLALAVNRGGRLVTFDRGITLQAVPHATPGNLVQL
jgi:hypothetical protein